MLQQVRNQIVEKIVSDVGDRYPELPYGCLHMITDSELDKTFSAIESRVQKERSTIENRTAIQTEIMRNNMNEGY